MMKVMRKAGNKKIKISEQLWVRESPCPLFIALFGFIFGFFFLNDDILEAAAIVDGIHAIETQPSRNNAVCPSGQLKEVCESH